MKKIRYQILTGKSMSGLLPVLVRCHLENRSIDIDTNVRILKNQWDYENSTIVKNPNSSRLNKIVMDVMYTLEDIELSCNLQISLTQLKRMWKERNVISDFYSIELSEEIISGLKPSTLLNHKLTFRILKEFSPSCSICAIDQDFVMRFIDFLRKKNYKPGTIEKHVKIFRRYYNYACRIFPGKVPQNSFCIYKPDKHYEFKIKSLDENDVKSLELYSISPVLCDKKKMIIDQFLFMCYTGMRFSDFNTITEKNILHENGTTWISYNSVKTDVMVKIPISAIFDGRAEQILYKYSDRVQLFFRIKSNSSWNRKIDSISKRIGIKKHITAHVARHTFASRLINKGVPISTIQKVIGHRKLETTMIYAKTNDYTLVRQLSF